MKHIWIATCNKNKKKEFKTLLEPLGFIVHTPDEIPNYQDVEETGETFAENAMLKAEALFSLTKKAVIADDSGIAVEALNGAPGIYSARFAGANATDEKNRSLLLEKMINIDNRAAQFVCSLALIDVDGNKFIYNGFCNGTVLLEERGSGGFGYDSLFFVDEIDKTMAEATVTEKNAISHRARALQKLLENPLFDMKEGK